MPLVVTDDRFVTPSVIGGQEVECKSHRCRRATTYEREPAALSGPVFPGRRGNEDFVVRGRVRRASGSSVLDRRA